MANKSGSDIPPRTIQCSPLEALRFHMREKERAYEAVRKGKVRGRIDPNGYVTVRVDAISSVTYRQGSVVYSW